MLEDHILRALPRTDISCRFVAKVIDIRSIFRIFWCEYYSHKSRILKAFREFCFTQHHASRSLVLTIDTFS